MNLLTDSAIIPEDVPVRFFAEHFKPYEFIAAFIQDKTVLEIGCGDGYGAAYLAQFAKEVIAIDYSAQNINHAQVKYQKHNLIFKVMDATELLFPEDTFDAVCSFQVIEHLPQDETMWYLKQIKRVLKQHGEFYLSTLNLEHVMKSPLNYKKNPAHCQEFTLNELKGLLSGVFPVVEIYGLHLTLKHRFHQRLKKMGILNFLPPAVNPVRRFYSRITTADFVITGRNLARASDFLCLCRKSPTSKKHLTNKELCDKNKTN